MAAAQQVECLRCGATRVPCSASYRLLDADECPRCTYVGWAASEDVSEVTRKALRDRSLERRRLRMA